MLKRPFFLRLLLVLFLSWVLPAQGWGAWGLRNCCTAETQAAGAKVSAGTAARQAAPASVDAHAQAGGAPCHDGAGHPGDGHGKIGDDCHSDQACAQCAVAPLSGPLAGPRALPAAAAHFPALDAVLASEPAAPLWRPPSLS